MQHTQFSSVNPHTVPYSLFIHIFIEHYHFSQVYRFRLGQREREKENDRPRLPASEREKRSLKRLRLHIGKKTSCQLFPINAWSRRYKNRIVVDRGWMDGGVNRL